MRTYRLTGEIRVQQAWKDDFQRYHHYTHLIAVAATVCACRSTEDARWTVMAAATEGYDWDVLKGWADGPHIEELSE